MADEKGDKITYIFENIFQDFDVAVNTCLEASPDGRIAFVDGKTFIVTADFASAVIAEIPFVNEIDAYVDLRKLSSCLSFMDKKSSGIIGFSPYSWKVVIDENKVFEYPLLANEYLIDGKTRDNTTVKKFSTINPTIKIKVPIDKLIETIEVAITNLRKEKKHIEPMTPVIIDVRSQTLSISNSNKQHGINIGTMKVDTYSIGTVKINVFYLLKYLYTLNKFTKDIILSLDTDFPLRLDASSGNINISVLVAPLVGD